MDIIDIKYPELTDEEKDQLRKEQRRLDKESAYRNESDPLFFKYQRGEVEKQVWLDKVEEIRARYTEE